MKQIHQINLFVSCPGDIKDELNSIRLIVDEINRTTGKQNAYSIETLNWKTDTYTQIGEDPQDVINTQLESQYDILLGLIWQRIGTPTKRDKSGTVEEINRAITNGKELLIYFRTSPPENLNLINIEQLQKVNEFKEELSQKGVLYKEYNSVDLFESLFRINLINLISDRVLKINLPQFKKSAKLEDDKYASISKVIDQVEQREKDTTSEIDLFELVEQIVSKFGIITSSVTSMTTAINDLNSNLRNRTRELGTINSLKDDRLRVSKTQIVINLLANELDDFSNRINKELPTFSENYLSIGPLYSKILQFGNDYNLHQVIDVKQSIFHFRDTVEEATNQGASMLAEIIKWPPATSRFNKSRRITEETLKNLIKDMLEGLKLLDEVIK